MFGAGTSFWGSGDAFCRNVILLLHMDGVAGSTSFPDSSRYTKSVFVAGNTQIANTVGRPNFNNSAASFDGSGDYLITNASADWAFGTGNFNVETFVNPSVLPAYFVNVSGGGAGGLHSAGVKSDGTLWTWGQNNAGQLGHGDYSQRSVPTQVGTASNWKSVSCGREHTIAVKTDGSLWAWGLSDEGQVGLGNYTTQPNPQRVGTANDWDKVGAGGWHSLAIKTDGTLWAWGWNLDGQLGISNAAADVMTPTQVGSATNWTQIVGGRYHSIIRNSANEIFTSGYGGHGALGHGNLTSLSTFTKVGTSNYTSIGSGQWHCIAVRTDGTLWTWGRNEYEQIGNPALAKGSAVYQTTPYQVGTRTDWSFATAGGYFNMALDTTQALWTFGDNSNQAGTAASGQLGINSSALTVVNPTKVGDAAQWAVLSAGRLHALGVKTDGSLWAWGDSEFYQLGTGSTTDQYVPYRVFLTDDRLIFGQVETDPKFALFLSNKNNALSFYRSDGNIVANQLVPSNQWSHVAVSRKDGIVRLFIEGEIVAEVVYNGNFTATGAMYVGGSPVLGTNFAGLIDELRVANEAIYTKPFIPPIKPFRCKV